MSDFAGLFAPYWMGEEYAGRIHLSQHRNQQAGEVQLLKMLSKAPVIFGGKWNEQEGHWLVIIGLSGDQLSYFDPLTGRHVCNWVDFFSGDATDLHAHAEEPLFYVK